MSLQLWITGNEALTNRGLANIDLALPYIIKPNGKTGKCINFEVSDDNVTDAIKTGITSDEWSLSFWIKDPDSSDVLREYIRLKDDNTSVGFRTDKASEWTHVFIIQKDLKVTIFVGESESDSEFIFTDNIEFSFGCFDYCDIRFYDHALSARERAIIKMCLIFEHQLGRGYNPSEIEATSSLGLDDTSGFKHTLSPSTTISTSCWRSASPVGDGALNFNGSFYLAFNAFNDASPYTIGTSDITISFWAYFEDWSNITSEFPVIKFASNDSAIFTEVVLKNNAINVTIASHDGINTISQILIGDVSSLKSGWHMFIITRSSFGLSIYVDGEELSKVSEDNSNYVVLGLGSIGKKSDGTAMSGIDICDIRIYSTCISSDVAKVLYGGRIGIDSDGNLYAHTNMIHDDDTEIGFGGNGNVKGEIIESDNGFKVFPDHFECKNFYET